MADTRIRDNLGDGQLVVPAKYDITSYGADFLVDGLVRRLRSGDIYIPHFQRKFVWNLRQSSRFIESLLLGLPVPGIFLSKDYDTEKLFVIDGQQRLKTLLYFYEGIFEPSSREFALRGVQQSLEGLTYKSLRDENRRRLDDSIIHATIVRQDSPPEDDSSIYYIFERINTGGTPLSAQEIRASVYHGEFSDLLKELNTYEPWRQVFGSPHKRMKDQELILRFFAFYYYSDEYRRPLKEFLNRYMAKNRHLESQTEDDLKRIFFMTTDFINKVLGSKAFRPERALNVAVFDSVVVAVTHRLTKGGIQKERQFRAAYDKLLSDEMFQDAVMTGTSDEKKVRTRMELAGQAFSGIE